MSSKDRPNDHHAADPADLSGSQPEDPGATTGLDRPLKAAGPVADDPTIDETDAGLEDRPLG